MDTMDKLTAIRSFASIAAGERVTIVRERSDWGMSLATSRPRLTLPKDIDEKDEDDRLFRQDFITRCPLARGFADITLTILHEVGHHFNREAYIFCDAKEYNNATGADHFKLHCEMVATDWAVQWLQSARNRSIAKAFEHAYFGH
jgi:hypothetical protein